MVVLYRSQCESRGRRTQVLRRPAGVGNFIRTSKRAFTYVPEDLEETRRLVGVIAERNCKNASMSGSCKGGWVLVEAWQVKYFVSTSTWTNVNQFWLQTEASKQQLWGVNCSFVPTIDKGSLAEGRALFQARGKREGRGFEVGDERCVG
jgi:hypothetical protein